MKKLFAALAPVLALLIAAPASAAAPYENLKWRVVGPAVAGGRVPAVAGTASDVNLYYIGAAGGGVWKTVNGGATWSPVFDKEDVSSIGAVTIDPTNENVVWVGTGESNPRNDVTYGDGVYKTTDGGKTWTNMGLAATRHISRILVDPKNADHVIVGAFGDPFHDSTDRGVYVTNDGGKTWSKTLYVGPQSGAAELAMDPNDPSIIFASIWQFRREPWTFHSGGKDDGIWRSADGGKTWTRLTGHGLPLGLTGRSAVAIAPSNSKRIYALIEAKDGILWRSDDGGENWTMVSNDTMADQRPFYFTHINVDPKDENHIYGVSFQLAESKDGGKKFHAIASSVHVDYHAMWIAPNDPNRIIVGEDGGYAITTDGKTWTFSRNVPIGQIYHVGLSNENPYWVCAPLQDNNAFCGPENSKNPEGILDEYWQNVVGGDGMWAVPEPADPNHIITDLQPGRIFDYNKKTQTTRAIIPYFDFTRYDFQLFARKYRFNWDSPIAFAAWNGKELLFGGNVLFRSYDRGVHWTAISPDLTLNLKSHQQPSGGPITLDVSSAENSDTLLTIETSPVKRGVIWTGADDGVIAVSTDDGKTWAKHVIPGIPPYGRVESISPSYFDGATAFANVDRHRSGDYTPYLFVTHDYGKTWHRTTNGLPANQWVRSVRSDHKNPDLVFAGTENGLWVSYDGGAQWSTFRMNLAPVSVRDIREQTQFNDLVIATHGRDINILDDLTAVQELPRAQKAGAMLFKPRTAYEYTMHSNDEGAYTRFAGQNPPNGAILYFYQSAPQANAPGIEILDAGGRVIAHIKPEAKKAADASQGDEEELGPPAPTVPNKAGINRVVWGFHEDGPPQWNGTKPEFRGERVGALVVPGTYQARIRLNGRTFVQAFQVKADPQSTYTQAQLVQAYNFRKKYLNLAGQLNGILNQMDAQRKELQAAHDALVKSGSNAALLARVDKALADQQAIFKRFTANFQNGEDSIQFPGQLREDIPRGGFGGGDPPTPALLEYASRFDASYASEVAAYKAFERNDYAPLAAQLKSVK
ncbi:MAG TPA: hypothetical protein VFL13_04540 [Candidatus Baltobacteraceae bacterium]|nr:hypothetical protein [Candidatus Baltobacteraceae bacterium]